MNNLTAISKKVLDKQMLNLNLTSGNLLTIDCVY